MEAPATTELAAWRLESFASSLTRCSANTVAAYRRDLEGFVEWAVAVDIAEPARVDRIVLRRYVDRKSTRLNSSH